MRPATPEGAAPTGAVRLLRPVAFHLVVLGHSPETIRETLGVDPATILLGVERVASRALLDAFRRAEELVGSAALGLRLAEFVDLRSFGQSAAATEYPLVQLLGASATVGEGLTLVSRYIALSAEDVTLAIEPDGDRVGVRLVVGGGAPSPCFVEFMLGWIVLGAARLATPKAQLVAVHLRRERPSSTVEHERILGVAPRYSAGEDVFFLPRAALLAPMSHSSPALLASARERADQQLAAIAPAASLAELVARRIEADLQVGRPTVSQVAAALGMSVRTLARRLEEDGTSYTAVLERVRRALARRYFDENLSANEIARRLRFSEPRTFRRAFREWLGEAPDDAARGTDRAPSPRGRKTRG